MPERTDKDTKGGRGGGTGQKAEKGDARRDKDAPSWADTARRLKPRQTRQR